MNTLHSQDEAETRSSHLSDISTTIEGIAGILGAVHGTVSEFLRRVYGEGELTEKGHGAAPMPVGHVGKITHQLDDLQQLAEILRKKISRIDELG